MVYKMCLEKSICVIYKEEEEKEEEEHVHKIITKVYIQKLSYNGTKKSIYYNI